jgi:hypothetical protein
MKQKLQEESAARTVIQAQMQAKSAARAEMEAVHKAKDGAVNRQYPTRHGEEDIWWGSSPKISKFWYSINEIWWYWQDFGDGCRNPASARI